MTNKIERLAKRYSSRDFLRQNHNNIAIIYETAILHKSFDINKFELLSRTVQIYIATLNYANTVTDNP